MRFGICHSRTLTITLIGAAIFSIGPAWAKGHHDLAKASQNPVSSLISVPFENNSNFNVGPEDAYTNVLNIKPVYPVNLGEWNLINRAILPVIYQDQRFPGEGSDFGLGNLTYQGFFSPAKVGKLIWGAGPSVVLPTRTSDRFGSETLAFGPTAVVLTMPGQWVIGALASNVWSVVGDDDAPDVNEFTFQYFVNYNIDDGWYVSTSPVITANWEANSDDRWTVPFGAGIGRVFKIGKQPVNMKVQGLWNAVKPDGAADWTLQTSLTFLFPK